MPRQSHLLLRERFGTAAGARESKNRRAFQLDAEQSTRMYALARNACAAYNARRSVHRQEGTDHEGTSAGISFLRARHNTFGICQFRESKQK